MAVLMRSVRDGGSQELNDRRLTLVEGSALSERDLVRTSAHASSAILLLADRFSPSSHQEDLGLQFQARPGLRLTMLAARISCERLSPAIVPAGYRHDRQHECSIPLLSPVRCLACCAQVWAVKSYTKSVPIYVQVLQRASLRMIAPFLDPERDVLVSVEQMRHRLLALSCLCPGASTLIGVMPAP